MPIRIICSWPALFAYAGALGDARLAYAAEPSEANADALSKAEKAHDAYRDLCLEADKMIGLDLSAVAPKPNT